MTSLRTRPRLAAAGVLLMLGLGVVGCSSSGDDASNGGDSGGSVASSDEAVAPEAAVAAEAPAERAADSAAGEAAPVPDAGAALIKTGNVELRSADVGTTLFTIREIVQAERGEIAQDRTEADDDGAAERALLTLRVPAERFDQVMVDLTTIEGAASISSTTDSEDVTTEVIDTDVRVRLQTRSIERISLLLDRAESIRDVVSIEGQLARREADLLSLQKQQAYLADQTAQATITLSIERPREKPRAKTEEPEETGFLSGLEGGWDAFTSVATGLLTATGAVLPFAAVALLVGVPAWVLVRRRRPAPTPVAPDPQSA